MLNENQREEFKSLRVEVCNLDTAAYFFVRKINRYGFLFKNSSREHILEELIALRYMENGLILHLTNLDDDTSYYSFRAVFKELNNSFKDQKALKRLSNSLKTYRVNLSNIKNKHRIERIAHLNYQQDLNFDEFLSFGKELLPLIIEANSIGDLIWGEPIQATFKLGSLEGNIDFKRALETLKVDYAANQSFS